MSWKAPRRATEWSPVPHGLGHSDSPEIENASGFPISFPSSLSNKTPVLIPGHDHTHPPKQDSYLPTSAAGRCGYKTMFWPMSGQQKCYMGLPRSLK